MKKFGSWTELADLVLRASNNNTGTLDIATVGQNTSYTFDDPGEATTTIVDLKSTQNLLAKTLTDPKLSTSGAGGFLTLDLASGSMTGNKTLTLDVTDLNAVLKTKGNVTFANTFTTAGDFPLTLTQTASTSVTLPTTGTLATRAGTETLTDKTLTDVQYSIDATVAVTFGTFAAGAETIQNVTSIDANNLATITGGKAGLVKVLVNSTGSSFIIDNGTGADAIETGTAAPLDVADGAAISLYYNGVHWVVIGGSGAGGGLTPTDVNTAFTAAPGNHYLVDMTSGAFTATLPASGNREGDVIRFTDAKGLWAIGGSNNLTIARNGATIDGVAEDLEMDIPSSWIQFTWSGTDGAGEWITDDPLSPSGLSWLNVEGLTGALIAETDKHYIATGSSAYQVDLPAGSDGFVFRISDSTQNFATNPITVSPQPGEAIDDGAAGEDLVLDLKGVWVQFMWDGTQWLTDDPIAPSNIPSIAGTSGGFLYSNGGDVANSETMFLNGAHVGLGTTTAGLLGTDRALTITAPDGTSSQAGLELNGDVTTGTGVQVGIITAHNQAGANARIGQIEFDTPDSGYANNSGVMKFRTVNAGSIGTAMTIDENQNVGIGTENPNLTLQVNGPMGGNWASKSVTANSTAVTISDVFSAQITGAGASRTNCTLSTSGAVAGQVVHLYGHTWSVQFIESTTATFAGGSSITLGNTAGNLAGITLIYNGGKWIEVARGGTY